MILRIFRRAASVLVTMTMLAVTTVLVAALTAAASASPGSLTAPSTATAASSGRFEPGHIWTIQLAGAGCESDVFAVRHAFTAVEGATGDHGRYRVAKKLTMTWTAGTAKGRVFSGTWDRKARHYAGTYAEGGLSVAATLVPVSAGGCAAVTTAPASKAVALGSPDTDVATVTGEANIVPSGQVHFYVCPGDSQPCTTTSTGVVDLGSTSLSGSGSSSPSTASAPSPSFTATTGGRYCFLGVYSGDAHYPATAHASTTDECFTAVPPPGPPVGITSLNKVGPHAIFAGGTADFVVSGDIVLNTDVLHQPWTGSAGDPSTGVTWAWDDAIDAKTNGNLYVYGTIHSNGGTDNGQPLWPLDSCFQPNVLGDGNPGVPSPPYQSGAPGNGVLPGFRMNCQEHGGSSNVDYDAIDPTNNQIDDPLATAGAPPNPLSAATNIACPGSTLQTDPPVSVDAAGVTQLSPGEYTTPVELTGSAHVNDCPGGHPGVYRFDQGLWINPHVAGQAVTGSDIVIATENPYPMGGNVPGSIVNGIFAASGVGNGGPCLPPTTMTGNASGNGSPMAETTAVVCGGTNPPLNGVAAYGDSTFTPDPSATGTGDNFSVIIGGVPGTTVALTGPVNGVYGGSDGSPGLVLYQDPNVQANDGFDAEAGDGAAVTLNGVVYNASLSNYGADAPLDYWDGTGGGIPFYAGGTLQTGFGTGWSDGPTQSSGSVNLSGTAVVDDFNTDGATTIAIIGQPYRIHGSAVKHRPARR